MPIVGVVPGDTNVMTITAKDAAANISPVASLEVVFDIVAPTAPSNLTVTNLTPNSFTLNWIAATDNVGVASYEVYKNSVTLGSFNSTSLNITGLHESTPYMMMVKARDAAGFLSQAAGPIMVTTTSLLSALDNVPYESLIIAKSGQIIVDLSNLSEHSVVSVTDLKGRLIKSVKASNTVLKINVPVNGTYLVTVQSATKTFSRKLVL